MKKFPAIAVALIFFLVPVAAPVFAHDHHHESEAKEMTKHFDNSFFLVTEAGTFSVELMEGREGLSIDEGETGIVIHDAQDNDVEKASLTVGLRLSGNEAAGPLQVKEKGSGLYTVRGVDPSKDGTWDLAVTVKSGSHTDKAVFAFPALRMQKLPKGRYSAETVRREQHGGF